MLFPCVQKYKAHFCCCLIWHWDVRFTFLLKSLHPVDKSLSLQRQAVATAHSARNILMKMCLKLSYAPYLLCLENSSLVIPPLFGYIFHS